MFSDKSESVVLQENCNFFVAIFTRRKLQITPVAILQFCNFKAFLALYRPLEQKLQEIAVQF